MDLLEVTNKRSVPGILILDHQKFPIFLNPVARRMLCRSSDAKTTSSKARMDIALPVEISRLYENLKNSYHLSLNEPVRQVPSQNILFSTENETLCCRGFFINNQATPSNEPFHVMILIEKISEHQSLNFEDLKEYNELRLDQAKRLYALEQENAQLKKLVAEISMDKAILKEAAWGNC